MRTDQETYDERWNNEKITERETERQANKEEWKERDGSGRTAGAQGHKAELRMDQGGASPRQCFTSSVNHDVSPWWPVRPGSRYANPRIAAAGKSLSDTISIGLQKETHPPSNYFALYVHCFSASLFSGATRLLTSPMETWTNKDSDYKVIILASVGLEKWSLIMRKEICLALLRIGVSGECLDERETEQGKYCVIRNFVISTLHAVSPEWLHEGCKICTT